MKQFGIKEPLENRNGMLHIGGISTAVLAEKYGTPLYIYDGNRITDNFRRVRESFDRHYDKFKLYYAVKANNNLHVLRLLRKAGAGADASCPDEIRLALKAGFKRDNILYSGVYHTNEELEFALKQKVKINLEDVSQVDRLLKIGKPEFISFRVNPGISEGKFKQLVFAGPNAKFGIIERDIMDAYAKAKKAGIKRFGIHMMTGSCVLKPNYFEAITEKLLDIAGSISKKLDIKFEFIDIGGGLGVPYEPKEKELDIGLTAKKVAMKFRQKCKEHNLGEPYLMMEPGRYIVCDAGILIARVHSIKNAYKKFAGMDAGMNTLLRPALYGAYHQMYVANKMNVKKMEKINVCGQICENTDILAYDRSLPPITEGDLIAVLNAGAYGYSMSSQYNTRRRAAEVMVMNGKSRVIRKRDGFRDIIRGQGSIF